jgi:colanic acid biosynthesis glycosyl transferase WcaI
MRIVVHDHAGHAFAPELARALAARGHHVRHLHCATFASAKADLGRRADDAPGFAVGAVKHRHPFAKYSYGRRTLQEVEYGVKAARLIGAGDPDVVLSANTPMLSQMVMTRMLSRAGIASVLWLQDIYSDAVAEVVRSWPNPLGPVVAGFLRKVDASTAAKSDAVVTISPRFRARLLDWGVEAGRVRVVPNWAPLRAVTPQPKDNGWSRSMGLQDRFVVGYTGVLGLKHDAATLFELASRIGQEVPTTVLVVADGPGFRWLAARVPELGSNRLLCVPFQAAQIYPEVLAAADVLLAVLTPEASNYSVPSKVLTYLCAGRPTVAAIPSDNDAAEMLKATEAGLVVAPGDVGALLQAIELLRHDESLRADMGARGRLYAEATFAIEPIADVFESLLCDVAASRARC